MSGADVVLLLLCAAAVGAGVLVVTSSRVIHAALWLVVSLGALAGAYVVLAAELVAWVQVLVYVGAVVVLLLFAAMLTRAPIGRAPDADGSRWPGLVVAIAAGGTLVTLLVRAVGDARADVRRVAPATGAVVGRALFADWVLPFEAVSLLLLAALVAAVVLSRDDVGADPGAGS